MSETLEHILFFYSVLSRTRLTHLEDSLFRGLECRKDFLFLVRNKIGEFDIPSFRGALKLEKLIFYNFRYWSTRHLT